ncbi:MAG: glycosyltransferase family 8 protein [Streptococcus mitis]|nr:glycosyltransferase family 8 protein [Streptococcus mitis]
MVQKAIVLAANQAYVSYLETTIKSICSHMKQIKFYILNEDIPTDWFQLVENHLEKIDSEIVNVRCSSAMFQDYKLPTAHLNYATYFRYLIPNHTEEDRVLYLDSDMIVTQDLSDLFELDMQGYPVAAVEDLPTTSDKFNAGLLLIDNKKWREEDVVKQLFDLTAQHHHEVYGDQGILNLAFQDNWYRLPLTYNLQVGSDSQQFTLGDMVWYDLFKGKPAVIHYTTGLKPWHQHHFNRFREDWWFYYGLSWDDVILRKYPTEEGWSALVSTPPYQTAIYTNSVNLHEVEKLIKALPQVNFNILAHCYFAPEILVLEKYKNVTLFPCFDPLMHEKVFNQLDFYLDINYEDEIYNIIQKVVDKGIPFYSFQATNHGHEISHYVFENQDVQGMIQHIKNYLDTLENKENEFKQNH